VAGLDSHVLDARGIPVIRSDRGGQVTYHGPGQLVVYPLLHLRNYDLKVREYVFLLEQVLIDTLTALGLPQACRKSGAPGVYLPWPVAAGPAQPGVAQPELAKVAALGIKVTRGCSWHGMALNVDMDLSPFLGINPCGYEGMQTVDLCAAGVKIQLHDAQALLVSHLQAALQLARSALQAT
jgi:lipoyl(octanoyl) transferase